jgi:Tol biopolymer transport system component
MLSLLVRYSREEDIWVYEIARDLTTEERAMRPTSWSPDGKTLAYTGDAPNGNGQSEIGLLTLDVQGNTRPFLQTPFSVAGAVFSPNGRFVAYNSDESGRNEVYVQSFPGTGGKWQISNEGGVQPVWARDGREFFYRNGDKMMATDVTPDGKRFVMLQDAESASTQIHVVLNWFEELKARVPVPKEK